ncbi:hypothetical protein TFKS16_0750 [Tannerella forsythia KS16]|nr:hypothetical protein TF3313_1373 [Tannerella forsythia 3313]BAR51044.1 hypothetical protein TFKS16_0750 [Tannerella forsythia KS16]
MKNKSSIADRDKNRLLSTFGSIITPFTPQRNR